MITEHDIRRTDKDILLGLGTGSAVLDILTSQDLLRECLKLLEDPHRDLVTTRMDTFGTFPISLNLHHDNSISIFIDGPSFEPDRSQAAGLYVAREELLEVISEALQVTEKTN